MNSRQSQRIPPRTHGPLAAPLRAPLRSTLLRSTLLRSTLLRSTLLRSTLLLSSGWLTACEGFPIEIDTPQLNEHALDDLKNNANRGSCKAGTYEGNVTGGKDFTGQCVVHGTIYITGDTTDLLRLRHVREVQGFIYLNGTVDLAEALPELQSCGAIFASGYGGLTLTGPATLKTAAGLTVEQNTALMTISGFDNVDSMHLILKGNTALQTVGGFSKVTAGNVTVEDNPQLASFTALASLAQSGKISIQRCGSLLDAPSLASLTTVDGDLQLSALPFDKIDGFPALQQVGALKLTQLAKLNTLQLPQLAVAPTVWMVDLPLLPTLSGLPQVQISKTFSSCVLAVCKAELDAFVAGHAASAQWILCDKWTPCTP